MLHDRGLTTSFRNMSSKDKQYPDSLREVLPKRGLVYQESNPQLVLCKPKLLPLKSVTLEKLEKMQKDANAKAKEMQEEIEKEKEQMKSGFIGGNSESSECMTFE